MKKLIAATTVVLVAGLGPALSGEARGVILGVNANAMTITMDNGETYALPPEFDVSLINEGMLIALAHDDDTAKTVTDMELLD